MLNSIQHLNPHSVKSIILSTKMDDSEGNLKVGPHTTKSHKVTTKKVGERERTA